MKVLSLLALAGLAVLPAQSTFNVDSEGFIRNWLVLAPIAITGESGATELDHDFLNGEATIKPKAGDTVNVGGAPLTWTAHQTTGFAIDFRGSFGSQLGEYAAGYAVTYVQAEEPMEVTLSLGTNDQGRVWLNGKEVLKFIDTRTLDRDADRIPVSLLKGQNVLVMKVINEVNDWGACARFMRGEAIVTNLKVTLTPQ